MALIRFSRGLFPSITTLFNLGSQHLSPQRVWHHLSDLVHIRVDERIPLCFPSDLSTAYSTFPLGRCSA